MTYLVFKQIHITCVMLSATFFLIRFFWRQTQPELLKRKWVKIVPHLIDTNLLLSAISLAVIAGINPFQHHWLTAKIVALLAYISFGTFAIKRAQTKNMQFANFTAAVVCFAYIICVAISKQVIPFALA